MRAISCFPELNHRFGKQFDDLADRHNEEQQWYAGQLKQRHIMPAPQVGDGRETEEMQSGKQLAWLPLSSNAELQQRKDRFHDS